MKNEQQDAHAAFIGLVMSLVADWDQADREGARRELAAETDKRGQEAIAFRLLDEAARAGAKKKRQDRAEVVQAARAAQKRLRAGCEREDGTLGHWMPCPTPRY